MKKLDEENTKGVLMDEEIELRSHGYVLMDEWKMILLSKVALIFSVVVSSLFALPFSFPRLALCSRGFLFRRGLVRRVFLCIFLSCRSGFGSPSLAYLHVENTEAGSCFCNFLEFDLEFGVVVRRGVEKGLLVGREGAREAGFGLWPWSGKGSTVLLMMLGMMPHQIISLLVRLP